MPFDSMSEAEVNAKVELKTCDICNKPSDRLREHYGHLVCSYACQEMHDSLCNCMDPSEYHERIVQFRRMKGFN